MKQSPPPLLKDFMQSSSSQSVISQTQQWLRETVIELNLCPFAHAVDRKNQIRYEVSRAQDEDSLLLDLKRELLYLSSPDASSIDTTLLIHPQALIDFLDYNDFLDEADAAVRELGLEGELQIASFHPQYQFAGTQKEDVENYTNRSPYPMLHLLREASIEIGLKMYPEAIHTPEQNIKTLRALNAERVKKLKRLVEF